MYNDAGVQVVSYVYDAWGNVVSMTDSSAFNLGTLNPIRYRGYYFDEETGLYYVSSRYYDPEIGRFISADSAIYSHVLGANLFLYCDNNPIRYKDPSGRAGEEALATWTASMWWLLGVDGVLPVGDIIYLGGMLVLGASAVILTNIIATELSDITISSPYYESDSSDNGPDESDAPDVDYPGDDPTVAPDGYEWKGKDPPGGKAGGYKNKNPNIRDSWHPDLNHGAPKGPHWDYNDIFGNKWAISRENGRTVIRYWVKKKLILEIFK